MGHGDENGEEGEALVICPGKSIEMGVTCRARNGWLTSVRGMDGYERAGMGSTVGKVAAGSAECYATS